jgi:hypothetical protein
MLFKNNIYRYTLNTKKEAGGFLRDYITTGLAKIN